MADAPSVDDAGVLIDLLQEILEFCNQPIRFAICVLACKAQRGGKKVVSAERTDETDDIETDIGDTGQQDDESEEDDQEENSSLDDLSESAKDIGSCVGLCMMKYCY